VGSANNFRFDELGNLIEDKANNIKRINWRADGKMQSVYKSDSTKLFFDYDGLGNRIAKHHYRNDTLLKSTFYTRDAQGNVMAVYEEEPDYSSGQLSATLKERYIYGSDRIGSYDEELEMVGSGTTTAVRSHLLGARSFDLKNHLGNVLSTITDRPIPIDANANGIKDYSLADLIYSTDYTPFGAPMRERTFGESGRYGFNGMEKDDEVKGSGNSYTTEFRQYDARLGRWLSIDPLTLNYPSQSPYAAFNNNPIYYSDPTGLEGDPEATSVHIGQNDKYLALPNSSSISYGECGRVCDFTVNGISYSYNETQGGYYDSDGNIYANNINFESLVNADFKHKTLEIAYDLNVDPNHLMSVMAFESGETFSPSVQNYGGANAYGLIQFMDVSLKDINKTFGTEMTTDKIKDLTAVEQLEYVKYQFLMWQNRGKSFSDVTDFYLAVFSPKFIGKSDSYTMYKKKTKMIEQAVIDKKTGKPKLDVKTGKEIMEEVEVVVKNAYFMNKGLDSNNDGKITKGEAGVKVKNKLSRGTKFYDKYPDL
jgi:RHS repeat-associated protein